MRIEEWLGRYLNTVLAGVVKIIWLSAVDAEGDSRKVAVNLMKLSHVVSLD